MEWIVLGKFGWLAACYVVGIGLGVVVHELGHGLMGVLATRERVTLELGRGGRRWSARLGRLELAARSRGWRYGATRYERARVSRIGQTLVALGGPLASLAAVVGFGAATAGSVVGTWEWIAFLGLTVANFRIWIVAVWPVAYRPEGAEGEEWLSDSLDIWRMWR